MSRPAFTMTNLLNLTGTTLYSPVAGTGRLVAAGRGARPAEDVARHRNVDVVFRFARDSPLEGGVSSEPVSEVEVLAPGNYDTIPRPLWMIIDAEKGYFGLK